MPAPDPVADAITRGLQAMIASEPVHTTAQDEPKPTGFKGLLRRLRRFGEDGSSGRGER